MTQALETASSEAIMPLEIRLAPGGRALDVTWADHSRTRLDAALLRRHCRSARSVRAEVEGRAAVDESVTIVAVELVGLYAVNLVFSDGEARGIYPWTYLRELAAG
jgi:DUF971 family protein